MKNQLAAALVWMGINLTGLSGFAANGVTDTEIIIGSSLPLEGGFAAVGQQTKLGMEACFRTINDAGGIQGRKLKLVTLNDGYEPVPCVQNTLKLIDEHKAFALCSYVGTPTSVKAMRVWQAKNVPVVGFYTGAGALRQPFNQYNIHVRASYAKEADAIVTAFVKEAGATKIAIFYQNDAFGEAVKSVTEAALTKANLKAIALGSFERNTLDIEKGLNDLKAAQPDAIVMVGTYAPLAKFVKSAKAAGLTKTLFHTVSFVGPEAFAKELGDASGNVFVTQVMPPFTDAACASGQEYIAALKVIAPDATPTFPGFEAYANARVLAEGIQRSGKDLSVAALLKSIEAITPDNSLGLKLSYSATDHEGLEEVFITRLGNNGYEIVKDWGALKIAGLK
jgi:branched-chain amino acid transport system substrate-binding protein